MSETNQQEKKHIEIAQEPGRLYDDIWFLMRDSEWRSMGDIWVALKLYAGDDISRCVTDLIDQGWFTVEPGTMHGRPAANKVIQMKPNIHRPVKYDDAWVWQQHELRSLTALWDILAAKGWKTWVPLNDVRASLVEMGYVDPDQIFHLALRHGFVGQSIRGDTLEKKVQLSAHIGRPIKLDETNAAIGKETTEARGPSAPTLPVIDGKLVDDIWCLMIDRCWRDPANISLNLRFYSQDQVTQCMKELERDVWFSVEGTDYRMRRGVHRPVKYGDEWVWNQSLLSNLSALWDVMMKRCSEFGVCAQDHAFDELLKGERHLPYNASLELVEFAEKLGLIRYKEGYMRMTAQFQRRPIQLDECVSEVIVCKPAKKEEIPLFVWEEHEPVYPIFSAKVGIEIYGKSIDLEQASRLCSVLNGTGRDYEGKQGKLLFSKEFGHLEISGNEIGVVRAHLHKFFSELKQHMGDVNSREIF
jgi:RNAse (barnase) inhibitor barstar